MPSRRRRRPAQDVSAPCMPGLADDRRAPATASALASSSSPELGVHGAPMIASEASSLESPCLVCASSTARSWSRSAPAAIAPGAPERRPEPAHRDSFVCAEPASHAAMNSSADSSALSQCPRMKSSADEIRRGRSATLGVAEALREPHRLRVELVRAPHVAREVRSTARLLTIVAAIGESISSAISSARSMSATPSDRRRRSSPCRSSSARGRGARRARARRPSRARTRRAGGLPRARPRSTRMRAETARTRAADAETESPASASARARCTRVVIAALPGTTRPARGTTPPPLRGPCRPTASKRVARCLERRLAPFLVVRLVERTCLLEQELGPLARRPARARARPRTARRRPEKLLSANARSPAVAQREARALGELVVVAARSADELERRAPVVREHLRVVLGSAEAVDPLRDRAVPSARDRRVGSGRTTTSRTSACANANSLSPSSDERRWRRTKPLRSSE